MTGDERVGQGGVERREAIPLREYVETLLTHESTATNARLDAMDKALILRTAEIERHLAALNGEQSRLAADRERFLPREIHDTFLSDFRKWQDVVNAQMASTTGRDRGVSIAWSIGVALVGFFLGAAGIVAGLLVRGG